MQSDCEEEKKKEKPKDIESKLDDVVQDDTLKDYIEIKSNESFADEPQFGKNIKNNVEKDVATPLEDAIQDITEETKPNGSWRMRDTIGEQPRLGKNIKNNVEKDVATPLKDAIQDITEETKPNGSWRMRDTIGEQPRLGENVKNNVEKDVATPLEDAIQDITEETKPNGSWRMRDTIGEQPRLGKSIKNNVEKDVATPLKDAIQDITEETKTNGSWRMRDTIGEQPRLGKKYKAKNDVEKDVSTQLDDAIQDITKGTESNGCWGVRNTIGEQPGIQKKDKSKENIEKHDESQLDETIQDITKETKPNISRLEWPQLGKRSKTKKTKTKKDIVSKLCNTIQGLDLKDDIKTIETEQKVVRRVRDKFGEQPQFGKFKVIEVLPLYYHSDKMKLAQIRKFSMASLVKGVPLIQEYIDYICLQRANIKHALRMLLQIEDLHTMLPYCSLYQRRTRIEKDGNRLKFKVNVPKKVNIDDILSTKVDEVVFVPLLSTALNQPKIKYKVDLLLINEHERDEDLDIRRHVRTLNEIKDNYAYVEIDEYEDSDEDQDEMEHKLPFDLEKNYDIIFRPTRYTFRVQNRALELLDDEKLKYVFPVSKLSKAETATNLNLEIINKHIEENPEQLQAVKQIVGGANPHSPYIVVGPPGTGKTTTIVEAILQLYIQNEENHILVTTGSNSACDTVALKICEYFETNPRLIELSLQRSGKNSNDKPRPPQDILRVFSKSWIKKNGFKNINPLIVENANFSDGKFQSPSVDALQKYNIIAVTLCTVGRLRTGIVGNWPFTHVFIDESSAITETEALVAITSVNTNNCRIIMSGDTKQLGPVVMSRIAAELGLKHSLMERLLKRDCYAVQLDGSYDCTLQTRLRRNFRSHPEILRLFNHLYYNDELIPKVRMESLLKLDKLSIITNPKFPITFEAVYGDVGISEVSKSSYNQAEVDKVIWIIYDLKKHTDLRNIGIVSPYRLQCAKIKDELKRRYLRGIEVGTAEIYQGREKPIIIASFVKSFCDLGFVTDPQRLNVMLSRAQSLLILVGNPRTLQRNDDFKYLIDECKHMLTFHTT